MYKFVKNNHEKANVFNIVLAVIAIVFTSVGLFETVNLITDKIASAAFIIALTFGLLYIASGYKKNANGYYKCFMIIYALQSIYTVVAKLCRDLAMEQNMTIVIITTVCAVVGAVCVVILAFVKNLGVSKSLTLAAVNFWVSIGRIAIWLIFNTWLAAYPQNWLPPIAIAALAYEFVIAKYVDKAERGTK